MWGELGKEIGADLGFRRTGLIYVTTKRADIEAWDKWVNIARGFQVHSRMLTAAEAKAMTPGSVGDWICVCAFAHGRARRAHAGGAGARRGSARARCHAAPGLRGARAGDERRARLGGRHREGDDPHEGCALCWRTAAKTMIERTANRLEVTPSRLAADTGYGSAEMLAWLVEERGIKPHIPVFDKSERTDGTFSRVDFAYDQESDAYVCPAGKQLRKYRRPFVTPRIGVTKDNTLLYRASKFDCDACALKARCCPNAPARKVPRSIHGSRPRQSPRHRQDRGLRRLTPRAKED